jgi:DNA-binding XRE family transcriptional regulator
VKKTLPDANEPRLYGRDFCPLLPEGKLYGAALGHHDKNPETGRTLYGTASSRTRTGGGHPEGLLSVMGHYYPRGAAYERRRMMVKRALQDLRRVVEESFGGIVAAQRPDGRWLTLEEAAKLTENELVRKVKWLLFVDPNIGDRMAARVQDYQDERYARGETPHPIKVTRSAEPATGESREEELEKRLGLEGEPLLVRLYATRKTRKLSQGEVGKLFGVSAMTVSFWEAGTDPDETGKTRGKPIPEDMVPLLVRWIEAGVPPTAEELAARKTRRMGVGK